MGQQFSGREKSPPRGASTRGPSPEPPHTFTRHAHIFSSAIREVLENQVLLDVSPDPLSLSQYHLLKLITLHGEHQIGEVANFLGVTPPAATKNIDKLERLGLVIRRRSREDRRATLLRVSSKGSRLVEQYEEMKANRLAPILEIFTTAEIDQLSDLLERFSFELLRDEPNGHGLCLRCSAYFDDHCPIRRFHDGCPYQRLVDARKARA